MGVRKLQMRENLLVGERRKKPKLAHVRYRTVAVPLEV
jgi:hypothetical protein